MHRHRHHPQRRPGEHHHRILGRDAAAFGDELGLAGMGIADRVELRLGDGPRHQRAGRADAGETGGEFQRLQRDMRGGERGGSGHHRARIAHRQDRQRRTEHGERLFRVTDRRDWAVPYRAHGSGIAHGEERRESFGIARGPCLGGDFRPDPRRIAQCDGEGRQGDASHRHLSDIRSARRGAGRAACARRAG